MQNLLSLFRPIESESLGAGLSRLCFNKLSGDVDARSRWKATTLVWLAHDFTGSHPWIIAHLKSHAA